LDPFRALLLKDHPLVTNILVGDWTKQETPAATLFKAVTVMIKQAVRTTTCSADSLNA
jgi:hypothetical protein